jgi:hypothetical protein
MKPRPAHRIVHSFKIAMLIFSAGFFFSIRSSAQDVIIEKDSVVIHKEDTLRMKSYASRFDPRKSLLYAAVVPGLGQVYNKKYWKLPLVYGGFYLIGRQINIFNTIYVKYRAELFYALNDPNGKSPSGRSIDNLRRIVDRSRHDRDFWIILMGGMYLLQVVDAHVDSHLKEFDLNPNLRVSIEPMVEQNAMLGRQTGMSVVIKF